MLLYVCNTYVYTYIYTYIHTCIAGRRRGDEEVLELRLHAGGLPEGQGA